MEILVHRNVTETNIVNMMYMFRTNRETLTSSRTGQLNCGLCQLK